MSAVLPISAPRPAGERSLWLAIGASLLVHAVLLSLHFGFPDASRAFRENALDIILVNSKSAHKPSKAQALAQANLDGGGNSEQDRRVKTPLPATAKNQSGNELEQTQKKVRELEEQRRSLLEQARGKSGSAAGQSGEPSRNEPALRTSGFDLARTALEMARLQGEISRDTEEYGKRPRVKNLGTSTEEYRFARYMEDWRIKIERIGTLNYPEAARGKLSGSLRLSVWIRRDGSVERIEIDRSSGHRVLDDAARRIVRLAEPFAVFPPDIGNEFDILTITRTWNFTSSNRLEAGSR